MALRRDTQKLSQVVHESAPQCVNGLRAQSCTEAKARRSTNVLRDDCFELVAGGIVTWDELKVSGRLSGPLVSGRICYKRWRPRFRLTCGTLKARGQAGRCVLY